MANSIQEFREEFESFNDLDIIAMIHLATEVYSSLDKNRKISDIISGWRRQMEIAGPGTIDLMLDDYLKTPEDRGAFFLLLKEIRRKVLEFGEVIPINILNMPVEMGASFNNYSLSKMICILNRMENFVK